MASIPIACPLLPVESKSSLQATAIAGNVTRLLAGTLMATPSTDIDPPARVPPVLLSDIEVIDPIDVKGLGSYGADGVNCDAERPKKARARRIIEKLSLNILED